MLLNGAVVPFILGFLLQVGDDAAVKFTNRDHLSTAYGLVGLIAAPNHSPLLNALGSRETRKYLPKVGAPGFEFPTEATFLLPPIQRID